VTLVRPHFQASAAWLFLFVFALPFSLFSQDTSSPPTSAAPPPKTSAGKQTASAVAPAEQQEQQDLQKAIDGAGNDRAALVRNLDAFLKKYPQSSQRSQIYRAIVEASLQLRDFPRATEFAERMVALNPEDPSINILSIQLLERYGDTAGWHRATYYCTRVLDIVGRTPPSAKPPRVSNEDWITERKKEQSSIILVRGRLYQKLNNLPDAQKDFETSFALSPTAAAAEHLGEIAELKKDLTTAIQQYARALALYDGPSGVSSRPELRRKLGNVWRLAHGSEDGLGDYFLRTFDEATSTSAPKPVRNAGLKDIHEFTVRKVSDGAPFPLTDTKGKILVLNFWATWCGPCRELEPHFEKIAARFAAQKDVLFFGVNCDEDETLVAPYLAEEKPKTISFFADGLEQLLRVAAYPTTLVLDRAGNIVYRSDGYDSEGFDKALTNAVELAIQPPANTPAAAVATP
jgi:thiol-disulfide isomerase/thioredoxin